MVARQQKGHPRSWRPFEPEESVILRAQHLTTLPSWCKLDGEEVSLVNVELTEIAYDYDRVVIGDYGAYVEISLASIRLDHLRNKWPGEPRRTVKYIWLESQDAARTKVYEQRGTVGYADYKVGYFYVDPSAVRPLVEPDPDYNTYEQPEDWNV
jgi:hypothetical protein